MSQNDFNLANQGFPSMRSDMNSALQALASNSGGLTEPATTYAYQWWYDSTDDLLKMRNADNDAWITFAAFDQATDTWSFPSLDVKGGDVTFYDDTGTTPLFFWDASAESLGIGTSSPSGLLDLEGSGNANVNFSTTNDYGATTINILGGSLGSSGAGIGFSPHLRFGTVTGKSAAGFSEKMRIDSSGNLLVGKASGGNTNTAGFEVQQSGFVGICGNNIRPVQINRKTSDGEIIEFRKDGSTVGSIGVAGGRLTVGGTFTGLYFNGLSPYDIRPINMSTQSSLDNVVDLGNGSARFDDIYATNGTIQTSDRNEKQDIEALSDAETRVAQACKGLLRKFRWKDAVEEKGDDARIHFGIIAQDLQDAFTAEGLDAGRYAMFISSTWWETQTEVPAVEAVEAVYEDVVIPAVLDEDGNEVEAERTEQQLVTEAVEAKEAYTRTDTYETLEEAPEGATERTRLGVRYPELLAFIVGSL